MRIGYNITGLCIYNNTGTDGGGIRRSGGTVNLYSTIIGGNTAGTGPDISCASGVNADFCLIQDMTDCILGTDTNNIKGSDPLLNALADNGGETMTHLPQGA